MTEERQRQEYLLYFVLNFGEVWRGLFVWAAKLAPRGVRLLYDRTGGM